MRTLAPVVFVLFVALVSAVGCGEEPLGEIVTCTQTFTCGLAESAQEESFCTRPGTDAFGGTAGADERNADIAAYQSEFADDCNGVNVRCLDPEVDGEFATCTATCVVAGTCDPETAVRVRL